jgi:hypothetical protein
MQGNTVIRRPKSPLPLKRKRPKVSDKDFIVPAIGKHEMLLSNNYRVSQLRQMCKHYGQKRSGNKEELMHRAYNYLKDSLSADVIQSAWRGHLAREWLSCKGVSLQAERRLCTNETDFLTMEAVGKIPLSQLFMFRDTDQFQYGFDIASLYNLVLKSGNKVQNPYNRQLLPKTVARRLRRIMRLGGLLGFPADVALHEEEGVQNMTPRRRLEMRTIDLCQRIDALGNHTNTDWFLSLNAADYQLCLKELWDIWHYRANLTQRTRQEVCPPGGNPFSNVDLSSLGGMSEQSVWRISLSVFERMTSAGIDQDARALGAIYVLTALTLVSMPAAQALPWLYQSVAHVQ